MKDIMSLMKQAKVMQAKMEEAKAKVSDLVAEGSAGGGLIRLTLSGEGHMKTLKIDPVLIDKDEIEILEDLLIAAFHDAKVKIDQKQQDTMKDAMGDIQLPPGMNLPF